MAKVILTVKKAEGHGFYVNVGLVEGVLWWSRVSSYVLCSSGQLDLMAANTPSDIVRYGMYKTAEQANNDALLFARLAHDTEKHGGGGSRVNLWEDQK